MSTRKEVLTDHINQMIRCLDSNDSSTFDKEYQAALEVARGTKIETKLKTVKRHFDALKASISWRQTSTA